MKWFRQAVRPHQLALSMIGAKPGDRVLVAGAGDGGLAAEVGVTTGLNGRTLVAEIAAGAAERAEVAAAKAGALIEFTPARPVAVPESDESFDVVVFNHSIGTLSSADRAGACVEALRLVRPGGRVVAIEPTRRTGLLGLASTGDAPKVSGNELVELVRAAGFKASRVLSEAEGLVFVEATRARV